MTTIQSIRNSIAKNIKQFRTELGLTQEKLAEKLGISNSHLANLECGKTGISDDLLCALCNVFNKKPSEIYSDIDTNFENDRRIILAVHDSVEEIIKDLKPKLSRNISERLANKIVSVEYAARRNERIPIRKVAKPPKSKKK